MNKEQKIGVNALRWWCASRCDEIDVFLKNNEKDLSSSLKQDLKGQIKAFREVYEFAFSNWQCDKYYIDLCKNSNTFINED